MSTTRYILRRTLFTIFLIWLVATVLFFFFRLLPGDYASMLMGGGAPRHAVEALIEERGLDDPLHIQYLRFLWGLINGDAGVSFQYGVSVIEIVRPRILHSALLAAPAITMGYVVGVTLGILFGHYRGSKFERYGVATLVFFGRFPAFFIAVVLVIVFSAILGWFPPSGLVSIETQRAAQGQPWWYIYLTWDFLWHYTLPFTAIWIRTLDTPALLMRTSVVEVKNQDFFEYMRIVGFTTISRLQHLGKHASLPVITVYPIAMTRAIGGIVLVEVVFSWPGIGKALVDGVIFRDFPIVQFVFLLIAAFIIVGNFFVDILYTKIDPRVEIGERRAS